MTLLNFITWYDRFWNWRSKIKFPCSYNRCRTFWLFGKKFFNTLTAVKRGIYTHSILLQAIPNKFHNNIGLELPSNINLFCKEGFLWNAQYDKERQKIVGLRDFLFTHEAKQHHILLFDYRGNNNFTVQIFNPNGMELDFNNLKPYRCKSERDHTFTESEYMVGTDVFTEERWKHSCCLTVLEENLNTIKEL